MASNTNPVDINNSSVTELKTIPNIGDRRASSIVKLREEKGGLTLEDLKTLPSIPSTIWDPLVSEGMIVFGERVESEEREQKDEGHDEAAKEIIKLQSLLSRQEKEIETKNIQLKQSELEIVACQQHFEGIEKAMKADHEQKMYNLEEKYKIDLENTKRHYEDTLAKAMTVKDEELVTLKQKMTDQDNTWARRMQELEKKIKQLEDEKVSREVDKLAPHGIYRKSYTHASSSTGNITENESKGPSPPKMSTFDGKSDWKPFFTQFSHIAARYKWTEEQKLDKLIECLRDKALKYFSSRPTQDQKNYQKLSTKLEERFGKKDLPHIIRRQLQDIKQDPEESVEEFADKVQDMTADGYPDTPENCKQTVAIDVFLRGCTNKQAALIAMDKNPATLDIAIQYIKSAITNQKLILGARKCEARRVKFESSESENETSDETSSEVRAIYNSNTMKRSSEQRSEQTNVSKLELRVKRMEEDNREIKASLENILQTLKSSNQFNRSRSNSRENSRVRSPSRSPNRQTCFKCNEYGHYARDCPNYRSGSPYQSRDRSPSPKPKSLNFNRLEK